MLTRKGQLFSILLCIFSVTFLGMALFYLAEKSAPFQDQVGSQSYVMAKLFSLEQKLAVLYQSVAQEDLMQALAAVLTTQTTSCGEINGTYYWVSSNQSCVPDLFKQIEEEFSKRHLTSQQSLRTLPKGVLGKSYELVVSNVPTAYTLSPIKENERWVVLASADYPWIFDVITPKKVASVSLYPHFRLDPKMDIQAIKDLQDFPSKIINKCQEEPDFALAGCLKSVFHDQTDKGATTQNIFEVINRDVIITTSIALPQAKQGVKIQFAVRIPARGSFFISAFDIYKNGEKMGDAFKLDNSEDPLKINATVSLPALEGYTVELCTKPSNLPDSRQWYCAGNLLVEDGKLQEATTLVQTEDQSSFQITSLWKKFPKEDFMLKLQAANKGSDIKRESARKVTVFLP